MQEKRLKLYKDFRKIAERDQELTFFDNKYKNFSDWEDKNFLNAATAKDIWNKSLLEIYSGTLDQFYKKFCCDLQWAKDAGYCGTVTPAPSPNPAPNPSPAPRPRTDRYTSVTYTGQDIINGETIEKGMKGSIVEKIQEHLNRHGANPALVVDGKFGDKTKKAVKDFQKSKSLSASGVVEDKTWLELIKDKSSTTTTVTPPKPVKDPLEDIYGTGKSQTPIDLFDY